MDHFSRLYLRVHLADGLVDVADRTSVRMSREAGLKMRIFICIERLIAFEIEPDRRFGHFRNVSSARRNGRRQLFGGPSGALRASGQKKMIIGNENDQVSKGQLVDALACTGDEGRDTLR